MSNSPMVAYTRLSPNHSGQRTHSIDRISPHCVVGQCSIETLGSIFAPTSRQASSNYGIGADGRVGMYVEEKNRSWCTSSNANDQRAVTIECASDTTHPYAMRDVVYATLIELCVDICKRNGKTKLLWLVDKDKTLAYAPAADEMVLTVHRWFANKSCPGDWLYNRLGDLAQKVTAKLGSTAPAPTKEETTTTTTDTLYRVQMGAFKNKSNADALLKKVKAAGFDSFITTVDGLYKVQAGAYKKKGNAEKQAEKLKAAGFEVIIVSSAPAATVAPATVSDPEKTIWNTLKGKGLSDFAVAGIMGNLYAESGLRSTNLQNAYEKSLGMTDDSYTAAVDNGSYGNFVHDSAGYGLAQWTYYSRKQALLDYAKSVKKSIGDLAMQLEFLWTEIQTYKTVMSTFASATSVKEASDVVLTQFEKPADMSDAVKNARAGYGQKYYDKYASGKTQETPAATEKEFRPYLVVVDATVLNIRKAPGTENAVVGAIRDSGVYTIVAESNGTGASRWGKLKSGAGWISLDYTTKLREV